MHRYVLPENEKDNAWPNWQRQEKQIKPLHFNQLTQTWEYTNPLQELSVSVSSKKLILVSYNIWYLRYFQKERNKAILKILKTCDADVICLQEVTKPFIKQMIKEDWVRNNYYISDGTGATINTYGIIILSRLTIHKLLSYTLPTAMARTVLVAEYIVNDEMLKIGTVHLESLDSAPTRRAQLRAISELFAYSEHVLLMGDFNFDPDCNFSGRGDLENDNLALLLPQFVDVWPSLYPDNKGYTLDSQVNRMITKHEQMRYDRVLLHSNLSQLQNKRWKVSRLELIGNRSFTTDRLNHHRPVFPSDHFGLFAVAIWE